MFDRIRQWFRVIIILFGRNWITLFGAGLTTSSALLMIGFLAIITLGLTDSPYFGIVAFMVMPGVFVLGLLIIPLGVYWDHRTSARSREAALAAGETPSLTIDLSKRNVRDAIGIVGLLTAANILIISSVSYRGVTYMDSVEFCGRVCHTVMEPEFTAHAASPHSRVSCVECHIGPGAPWFVKAKIDGVRQVFAVALHTYQRPIPTPVEHLRPSRDTCEQCHWPERFAGDRLKVITEYSEDEANTPLKTVLLMHVGGGNAVTGGIHSWHIDPKKQTTYLATDPQRQNIALVRVKQADGSVIEYRAEGSDLTPEQIANAEMRVMDCIDCHNRPTHIFDLPARALDKALAAGRIDAGLPFIKKTGVEALTAAKGEEGDLERIAESVRSYYQTAHAEIFTSKRDKIDAAIEEMQAIYRRNVFPKMKVSWGTYPDNSGHVHFAGCFRCHNDTLKSSDGSVIRQDCTICHAVLSLQEENPSVLNELGLQ